MAYFTLFCQKFPKNTRKNPVVRGGAYRRPMDAILFLAVLTVLQQVRLLLKSAPRNSPNHCHVAFVQIFSGGGPQLLRRIQSFALSLLALAEFYSAGTAPTSFGAKCSSSTTPETSNRLGSSSARLLSCRLCSSMKKCTRLLSFRGKGWPTESRRPPGCRTLVVHTHCYSLGRPSQGCVPSRA